MHLEGTPYVIHHIHEEQGLSMCYIFIQKVFYVIYMTNIDPVVNAYVTRVLPECLPLLISHNFKFQHCPSTMLPCHFPKYFFSQMFFSSTTHPNCLMPIFIIISLSSRSSAAHVAIFVFICDRPEQLVAHCIMGMPEVQYKRNKTKKQRGT